MSTKSFLTLALVLAACGPRPPTITEDGKYCTWGANTQDIAVTSGTCIKDNVVMTCMYVRDAKVQVVCGTSCPIPVESPKVSK